MTHRTQAACTVPLALRRTYDTRAFSGDMITECEAVHDALEGHRCLFLGPGLGLMKGGTR